MASKRKSTIPCMIPVKTMHMRDDVEQDLSCTTRDSAYPSRESVYSLGYPDLGESSRHDPGDALKDGGTYTCRPCNFETLDLNLFLDHVYSGHPEFRSDPSFHCVDCGVTAAKFEGLALHNARVHPSTVTTTLQLRKRDRKVTVEQSLVLGPGDSLISKESEISITKTPIMRMLKGKSEPKRIVVSHSAADDPRLEAMTAASKPAEKKDTPTVTVTHVPTIVHNGSTSKVTLPSAIQIVNGSGALPIIKTAVTQVVSVVQNRGLHQHSAPTSVSSSPSSSSSASASSSGSSKNLPKVMIPLSSIPTYNASMDNSSFLKTSFSKFPYPTKAELCYLTVVTKYPEEQIKIWFTAQRLKQGISWSPEEIEEARRKMFNTIIQTAPSSGHQAQQHQQSARQAHHSAAQQTITVLPASLGATGIPHILQGSLVGQGGVIVTQPMMANGIQVSSAPVALAVTPKPQSAAKPMMQARPAAALVADKGVSMVVGTVGSSSSLNYTFSSSSSSNGGANSSSSSSGSNSSSSIISSSSISSGGGGGGGSNSSSIASSSQQTIQTSVINTGGATSATTTVTSATSSGSSSGKTISGSSNNASSPASITTKTSNANKSTENGKSAANGKNAAHSPANAKTNQDAKSGSNGKDGSSSNNNNNSSSSSSSTVKSTKDGKASPDIKTSTDSNSSTEAKSDGKPENKSNGTSPSTTTITTTATTTNANTSTKSTSATAATTATSAAVTATSISTTGGSSSSKKGDATTTTTAAAASSPSTSATSSSRTLPSPSILDPNFKQNKKSQEQLLALKQSFLNNQFPNQDEVNRLTSLTGLTVREVRKWFSDRRYHFRNLKGPRTSTGGQAAGDKSASPATTTAAAGTGAGSGAGTGSSEAASPSDRPKTPPPTPVSPPQQQQQTTSPTTPSRRPPRPPSPDFTAIRYKEREPHQLVALEASFSLDPDPASEEVDRLRQETKMTRREIHGWFAERRKRAAAEKKKEEAERAEKEAAMEVAMEVGEKSEATKEEGEEKMVTDEPSAEAAAASLSSSSSSSSSQQGKDEKQKEDAPKVNPIKINLKMLKVTESNGKEGETPQPNQPQADPPKTAPAPAPTTSPIPVSGTPYRGKKTADQLHVLKQAFARTQWPGSPQYDELMAITGLPRPEVVRWFGDCRYVLKNGQLKWLESYQSMVEEEDFHKANLEVLKEHLEAHGKLEESQVKELAKASGLTEDLVRRWFTNRAPLLLAAKKAEEEGGQAAAVATEEVAVEKEPEEKEEKEKEKEKEQEEDEKEEKEEKEEGAPGEGEAQQDQGSTSEQKSEEKEKEKEKEEEKEEEEEPSPTSATSTHDSAKTRAAAAATAADSKSTDPDQGAA